MTGEQQSGPKRSWAKGKRVPADSSGLKGRTILAEGNPLGTTHQAYLCALNGRTKTFRCSVDAAQMFAASRLSSASTRMISRSNPLLRALASLPSQNRVLPQFSQTILLALLLTAAVYIDTQVQTPADHLEWPTAWTAKPHDRQPKGHTTSRKPTPVMHPHPQLDPCIGHPESLPAASITSSNAL